MPSPAQIALSLHDVEQGVACAGTVLESRTFLVGKKAFLFVSRKQLRLKLGASAAEAKKRGFEVGAGGWTKLDLEELPAPSILKKWITESHAQFAGTGGKRGNAGRMGGKKVTPAKAKSASALIDARIEELGDWRGAMLAQLRALVHEADSGVVEEWKWNVPVWSHAGILCTGEVYKSVVKLTFAKGASLADPAKLFNSSLEGNTRRAIDFREGDKPNAKAFKSLIRAAVAHNEGTTRN